MLTMNAFYACLASPRAREDAHLRRLLRLNRAILSQVRAFKADLAWEVWSGVKA